jgi:hypothetical protein
MHIFKEDGDNFSGSIAYEHRHNTQRGQEEMVTESIAWSLLLPTTC